MYVHDAVRHNVTSGPHTVCASAAVLFMTADNIDILSARDADEVGPR